jgi:hypothetical protein
MFWLRLLVVTSLLAVAAVIGFKSYEILRKSELKLANSHYASVSTDALEHVQVGFLRVIAGCSLLTGSYNARFSSESAWPNVNLGSYFTHLQAFSTIAELAFSVVLRPEQVADWQTYAFNRWDNSPGIPPNRAVVSATQRGVWDFDPEKAPAAFLDDLSGKTSWGNAESERIIIAVSETQNFDLLGLNLYPNPIVGPMMEKALLCAAGVNPELARKACTIVTPPLPLPAPSPIDPYPTVLEGFRTAVLAPVSIVRDDGAYKAVGVVTTSVDWADVLAHAVPNFVGELDVVVTEVAADAEVLGVLGAPPVSFTFAIKKGVPTFLGVGDLHDPKYNDKKHSGELYSPGLVGIAESTNYTVSFYPRKAFYDDYLTYNPIFFATGAISLIVLCSLIFGMYDFAVSRQSVKQQEVLDIKRRYVRFVSHEIRTPLNTVKKDGKYSIW